MNKPTPRTRAGLTRVTGALLLLMAVALGVGGGWLIALGGSAYYLVAALLLGAVGALLLRRSPNALWLYAVLLAGTLAWALWETGLDWWPLAARLGLLFLLGLLLMVPRITRSLGDDVGPPSMQRAGRAMLGGTLALCLLVAVVTWTRDVHNVAGDLPPARQPAAAAAAVPGGAVTIPAGEWHAYGRTGHGQRYSPLDQITPDNVAQLEVAWQYRTGDVRGQPGDPEETTFQVTPLKVGNRLYLCTPHQSVIAMDATTGAPLWRYDTQVKGGLALQHLTCRGLSYQAPPPPPEVPVTGGPGDCRAKLFMPTADGRLLALNPDTGALCSRFGNGAGQIDLWDRMPNVRPGAYYSTSPVVVTEKLVIVGGTVLDNVSTREQSGVIRAFDIETGALVWNWDSSRPDVTTPLPEGLTYVPNSPNSWAVSSVDEALGMVYIPMGNEPPDQWGGNRNPEGARFSSAVVALDLASGQVRWVYQTVHHDLWDYDVPAQPSLVDLTVNGATVPALVQPTKQGEVFVLDRRTGKPLLAATEQPAPQGAATGDRTAPTQPKSALSFDPPRLTGRDMWGATLFDQLACRIAFQRLRYEGRFTPPSLQGSLIYPGNFGVFNWGGIAVDPVRQVAFATPTYLAFTSKLVPRPDDKTLMVHPGGAPEDPLPALNENMGAPFAVELKPFTSPIGIPCQAPPWGFVAGADLTTGQVAWRHRNGTVRDLTPLPLPFRMGVPNLGGPIITAGGVAFLSGTLDYYVRGYDLTSGRELWRGRLPAGGQATPMTYTDAQGRQVLLVVAGGHGSLGTKAGDHVIAYALPRR